MGARMRPAEHSREAVLGLRKFDDKRVAINYQSTQQQWAGGFTPTSDGSCCHGREQPQQCSCARRQLLLPAALGAVARIGGVGRLA